jgi:hypothetical protein
LPVTDLHHDGVDEDRRVGLVCAIIAFNLTRAAGTLASVIHDNATTGTIRAQLINVPGRLARSARQLTSPNHPVTTSTTGPRWIR